MRRYACMICTYYVKHRWCMWSGTWKYIHMYHTIWIHSLSFFILFYTTHPVYIPKCTCFAMRFYFNPVTTLSYLFWTGGVGGACGSKVRRVSGWDRGLLAAQGRWLQHRLGVRGKLRMYSSTEQHVPWRKIKPHPLLLWGLTPLFFSGV